MPKERNLIVTEGQISRREFLKFLGSGAVALGLGVFGFSSFLNYRNTVNNKNNSAIAQSAGSWGAPTNQPQQTSTVHAALIAGGKVFWLMGLVIMNLGLMDLTHMVSGIQMVALDQQRPEVTIYSAVA